MVLVCEAGKVDLVMQQLAAVGEDRPMRLGHLVARAAPDSPQVVMKGDVL